MPGPCSFQKQTHSARRLPGQARVAAGRSSLPVPAHLEGSLHGLVSGVFLLSFVFCRNKTESVPTAQPTAPGGGVFRNLSRGCPKVPVAGHSPATSLQQASPTCPCCVPHLCSHPCCCHSPCLQSWSWEPEARPPWAAALPCPGQLHCIRVCPFSSTSTDLSRSPALVAGAASAGERLLC